MKMFGTLKTDPVQEGFCDSKVKSYSGYFDIKGSKNQNYFYWFFESRNDPTNDPVILWLTGGPGCSSTLALLVENGPCSVSKDGESLIENPYSWNENANIVFVDQPTGVGFSYGDKTDYDYNEEMVAEDMYQFLQAFFSHFSQFQKNEFNVFGESYGGHYAPSVAYRVLQGNLKKQGLPLKLAGLGVGNGLTAPEIQYAHYPEFYANNTYGVKLISDALLTEMKKAQPMCQKMIEACQKGPIAFACTLAQASCNAIMIAPFESTGLNTYDIRIKCEVPGLCYDFSNVEKFLRKPETLEALNVNTKESASWESCNMKVNKDFRNDWMKSFMSKIPPLLENKIQVLIYAGDADFICNWMGNKAWVLAMDWPGKTNFNKAQDNKWLVNNEHKGELRSYGDFHFLRVFQAGHMVPMDQPEAAVSMVNSFIKRKLNPV